EQEVVTWLVRVERVRQDASLGHEHVRREERAEGEREATGDVQEWREQPQRSREQVGDGLPGHRVDEVRLSEGRGDGEEQREEARRDDADRHEDGPTLVLEV